MVEIIWILMLGWEYHNPLVIKMVKINFLYSDFSDFIINFTKSPYVGGSRAWSGYGQHDGRPRTSETEGGKTPSHGERAGWGTGEYSELNRVEKKYPFLIPCFRSISCLHKKHSFKNGKMLFVMLSLL